MNTSAPFAIGDVVRETGLPADTLRYYERRGLVPPPPRTSTGRRAYDARAIDRLQFIRRARELGCSLDEIPALLPAFDEDCATLQAELAERIEAKVGDVSRRVADLLMFDGRLREARAALGEPAVVGPCAPGCACLDDAQSAEEARSRGRPASVEFVAGDDQAIACTLPPASVKGRIADWHRVLERAGERSAIDGGIRISLERGADLGEVARLAREEHDCCSFLAFSITIDARGAALEVRAPAEARTELAGLFGVTA